MQSRQKNRRKVKWFHCLALAILLTGAFFYAVKGNVPNVESRPSPNVPPGRLAPEVGRAREFIEYNRSIALSSEQRKVLVDALSPIKAPCCSNNSMATCCCPCNLAKTIWGLSKHLIVDKGYDASQVRTAALDWLHTTNRQGYSGDACLTGHCNRAFAENGCGGMDDADLIGVP